MKTVNSPAPLLPLGGEAGLARLVGRRQRFLMDLEDASGPFTAHTNNTGTMLGLLRPGSEVLTSRSPAPGRKYARTVEAVRHDGFWVGVNTAVPTRLLRAAWQAGLLPQCAGYAAFRTEPPFEGGRLDALLTTDETSLAASGTARGPRPVDVSPAETVAAGGGFPARRPGPPGLEQNQGQGFETLRPSLPDLWIETKNVTLVEDCQAQFPDAPSERARKHLLELSRLARAGSRAALFFAVQRPDARCFAPAWAVDEEYARLFVQALEAGVEVWAYEVRVSAAGYDLGERLPLAPLRA